MSAADALPPLTANELARLVAELRRNIDKGGYEGQPWSEEFKASAQAAYAECRAEVEANARRVAARPLTKAKATRPIRTAQPALVVVQNKSRAA